MFPASNLYHPIKTRKSTNKPDVSKLAIYQNKQAHKCSAVKNVGKWQIQNE